MILSVSRRTDIPAFFSEWFYNRIKEGDVSVRNPMNVHQVSHIKLEPDTIECIVFWTKNPSKEFINNLHYLDEKGYKYYFQFTITSYNQGIETDLPQKKEIINTFIQLSKKIGKEKIIWRYDPIFLNDEYTFKYHAKYFEYIAKYLSTYTNKCIISFVDTYSKIEKRLEKNYIKELSSEQMLDMAHLINKIAKNYGLTVESCSESLDLTQVGVEHGHCIDGKLINTIIGKNNKFNKDKTQRQVCGCVTSIDIGSYNTCMHNCKYCYANWIEKQDTVCNPHSQLLCSELESIDKVNERLLKKSNAINSELLFDFSCKAHP